MVSLTRFLLPGRKRLSAVLLVLNLGEIAALLAIGISATLPDRNDFGRWLRENINIFITMAFLTYFSFLGHFGVNTNYLGAMFITLTLLLVLKGITYFTYERHDKLRSVYLLQTIIIFLCYIVQSTIIFLLFSRFKRSKRRKKHIDKRKEFYFDLWSWYTVALSLDLYLFTIASASVIDEGGNLAPWWYLASAVVFELLWILLGLYSVNNQKSRLLFLFLIGSIFSFVSVGAEIFLYSMDFSNKERTSTLLFVMIATVFIKIAVIGLSIELYFNFGSTYKDMLREYKTMMAGTSEGTSDTETKNLVKVKWGFQY